MKVTAFVFTAASLAGLALGKTDSDVCWKKNQNVVKAIEGFCSNSNVVVPSTYAKNGYHVGQYGNHDTTVQITGDCGPPQWVPHHYCMAQFYNMCANGKKHGDMNLRQYGRNNCQRWHILVGKIGTHGACPDCM